MLIMNKLLICFHYLFCAKYAARDKLLFTYNKYDRAVHAWRPCSS